MAANGVAETMVLSKQSFSDMPENETDNHDNQKKKSAFQITSVTVKKYQEDDNHRNPRSLDELDLDADRNDVSGYLIEPGYDFRDNDSIPGVSDTVPVTTHFSIPGASRAFSHALDPKASRFVVVKVESKEPYTRGRWKCMDFFDESERGDISIVKSADSSGSSRASSVNYVHGVDDPMRNPLLHSIAEATKSADPTAAVTSANEAVTHYASTDGPKGGAAGYPLPQMPPTGALSTSHPPVTASASHSNIAAGQLKPVSGFVPGASNVKTQLETAGGGGVGLYANRDGVIYANATGGNAEADLGGQELRPAVILLPAVSSALLNAQAPKSSLKPELLTPGRAQVPTVLAMTLGETLGVQVPDEPLSDVQRDDSGTAGVAIDNKIEQAMDLVKSHLMFAVREEVEDLRKQIKELVDEKNRLDYENSILRAALSPDMLAKLLPPTPSGGLKSAPPQNSS